MGNYKTIKCKNYEQEGTCRYGAACTFAHGDEDIRAKGQNLGNSFTPYGQSGMDQEQYMQWIAGNPFSQMTTLNGR